MLLILQVTNLKGQADDDWPASQENQIVSRSKSSWHAQEGQEGGEEDDQASPLMRSTAGGDAGRVYGSLVDLARMGLGPTLIYIDDMEANRPTL